MEFYFFVVSFMSLVAVTSSLINLPECESCSGRVSDIFYYYLTVLSQNTFNFLCHIVLFSIIFV